MIIDAHIHTGLDADYQGSKFLDKAQFMKDMNAAGVDGGIILSACPRRLKHWGAEKRMEDCLEFCAENKNLYPFYWISPLDEDAMNQVDMAISKGFIGFKMICSDYPVDCNASMDLIAKIAEKEKPILFHSGICWDGLNSANYNKPANFEALIDIPKLKFSLAHVSWPWYDECIAVYGKFNNAYYNRPGLSCEMFIDVTPGTPRNYREDVWKHLFGNGYDLRYNLIFGTDCNTGKYNTAWAKEWIERDNSLYEKYVDSNVEDFIEHVYYKNALRFMGLSDENPEKTIPMVGE